MDIAEKLEERAISYEASGPSAHHTAALLREAKFQIERLREALGNLLGYAEEGCPEGGYICVIEARAALKGIRLVDAPK